jgi:hypothetical protein
MRRRSQQAGQHQTDVGFRREVDGRFRKGPTAVMGQLLPKRLLENERLRTVPNLVPSA